MNIIITGASSGIGFETALALSLNSENKILCVARNKEALEELSQKAEHQNIRAFSLDLNSMNFADLVEESKDYFSGPVQILINNAGYLVNKPFELTTIEDWSDSFRINVIAVAELIRFLLPHMDTQKGSHIVNIASMGGIQGTRKFPGLTAYSASKAAINSLTESLAMELKDKNIRVNALSPGAVQTPMLEKAFPGFQAPVTPKTMGAYIADFALNASRLMNGRLIQVSLEN